MIELILFIGAICLLFFIPIQFRIFYQKVAWDDSLILEMSFLKGMLKRRKIISLLKLTPKIIKKREKTSGRWFFIHKAQTKEVESSYQSNSHNWQEFLQRYQQYGLGMTLLTYFLPARYQHWLYVAEDLEKRGSFTKFIWRTTVGAGDPASTALIYGLIWSLTSGLVNFLHHRTDFSNTPEIRVVPDFQSTRLDLFFDCIFQVKLGYIIIAAFIARFRHRFLKGGIGVGEPSN